MSAKHEEIDLNADAVSVDRENVGDATVTGVSVAETLMEPCAGQGEAQGSEIKKVRVFDPAKVICDLNIGGNDVHLNSKGVDREADVSGKVENEVEKGSEYFNREVDAKAAEENNVKCGDDVSMHDDNEVETGSEQLDRGVDAKIEENNGKCGEDVTMPDENEDQKGNEQLGRGGDAKADESNVNCGEDVSTYDENEVEKGSEPLYRGVDVKAKENNEKCGENVFMHDKNEVEGAPVAVRASSEVEMHPDMNVGPVGKEFEQGTHGRDTIQSLHQKFEEATSDELENKAMEIDTKTERDVFEQETNDGDKVQSLRHKFEEATSDELENKAMEVDTQTKLERNEDQHVDVPVSEVPDSSNVLNESHTVNLVVDLHPYMAKDGNSSSELKAKLVNSRSEFCEGDLVWGKVRGHPWWPGQIFNLSAASKKAKKYLKKDSYLVAYFGDQTFAWNDASKIKPFQEHFARMEKQTKLEDFHYAVDCTLEEVARRVEFGLACSCVPEEALAKIKTQIIVNAGIREESSTRDVGDSFSNAASFEPVNLSERIKTLARLPYNSEVDRLEFVTVKAQLSAFYRWKGYLQLPEFNMLGGLLESDAEIPLSGAKHDSDLIQSSTLDFNGDKKVSSETGKLKSQSGSSHKRRHSFGDSKHPSKKERSLSDLLAERRANMLINKRGTDGKGDELISFSGKKLKSVDYISDGRVVKHKKLDSFSDDMSVKRKKLDSISDDMSVKHKKCAMSVVKHVKGDSSVAAAHKCLPMKKTFGVGNSILKVASQLNGSSPIFKSGGGTSEKTVVRNKIEEKSLFRTSQSEKQFPSEETSPAELLSQLCLAARDPMEGYNLLISLVSFFSDFRNSVSVEQSQEEVSGDKTGKIWTNSETTETSGSVPMKDTYWTDRIIRNVPQEQQALENKNEAGEVLHETPSQKDTSPVDPTSAVQFSAHLESALQTAGETFEQEEVKPADPLDGCCSVDLSPTALILNFTDLDSVPSKENLNKIFSRFGPLNELETEVKKSKRAKVVFKRCADAELAFSSAGKYSIFGPSLVSYCLKYMPSTPSKASSRTTKQSKNVATSEGGKCYLIPSNSGNLLS